MPTNRARISRKIKKFVVDPAEVYFLQHGTSEGGPLNDHLTWEFFCRRRDDGWQEIWEIVREEILTAWIENAPCTRPWAWWEYEAPRWERKFGAWFDGTKPKPRQRIGGTGTPKYDALNYVPYFDRGIPSGWLSQSEEGYYSGRVVDMHKKTIGTKQKVSDFNGKGIDPDDPPIFESEAAYLDRHKLLTPTEKTYLKKHRELLEPERVLFDDM